MFKLFQQQLYVETGKVCLNSKECLTELNRLISTKVDAFKGIKNEYQKKLKNQTGAMDIPMTSTLLLYVPLFAMNEDEATKECIERAIKTIWSYRDDIVHLGDRIDDLFTGALPRPPTHPFHGCNFKTVFAKLGDSVELIYMYLIKLKSSVISVTVANDNIKKFHDLNNIELTIRHSGTLHFNFRFWIKMLGKKKKQFTINDIGKSVTEIFPTILQNGYEDCEVKSTVVIDQKPGRSKYMYDVKICVLPSRNILLNSETHLTDLKNRYSISGSNLIEYVCTQIKLMVKAKDKVDVHVDMERWDIILVA